MVEKKYGFWWIVRCIVLWLVVFIMVFPFLHMLSVSLSSNLMVMQNKVIFWPLIGDGQFGLTRDTYKFILSKPLNYVAYKKTIT